MHHRLAVRRVDADGCDGQEVFSRILVGRPTVSGAHQSPTTAGSAGRRSRARLRAMRDYGAAARQLVRVFGLEGAHSFLTLLEQPDHVRADVFRQIHERSNYRVLEDVLVDLETDALMRGWLAEHLRLELGLM
jgi:hypothetical protein